MAERSIFKRLVEPSEAIESVVSKLGRRIVERILAEGSLYVNISDLHGRLVAETVRAPRPLPWYPRSLVDGCAVRSEDVAGAFEDRPVTLTYAGRVKIGNKPERSLEAGECFEVDTGAWIPVGADAVVPIEYVTRPSKDKARIERGASPGQNIALPGTDVAAGDQIAWPGMPGTPETAAALAAIGMKRIKATRRIRVAVFSTGDELIEPGMDPDEASIYDSNRFQIIMTMRGLGYDVIDLGIARDNMDSVDEMIIKAVGEDADIIITSGGTSAGLEDVVYRALQYRGEVIVHGIRIKPGKPTVLGALGEDRLFVGLPGNPRSASNVLERVVMPLLSRLGLPVYPPITRQARAVLMTPVPSEKGRHTLVPVAVLEGYERNVSLVVAKDSYMIASYPKSDGIIIVPAGTHRPPRKGDTVEVMIRREPYSSIIALTDSRTLESIASEKWPNMRIINHPTLMYDEIIAMLPKDTIVITPRTRASRVDEIHKIKRDIILLKHGDGCSRIAVFTMYQQSVPSEYSDSLIVPAPRVSTALVLLEQGYVDCAIIPGDYGYEGARIGSEEVVLGIVKE